MQILCETRDFVVCCKPVGLDSEHQTPAQLNRQLGGEFYPIHRLDQNVGGLMVFARTPAAAAALSKAVQEGKLIKEYTALVHGTPPESAIWEDLLWKDARQNKVFVVKRMRKGVKPAKLEFTRLTQGEKSLVHIRLHTGRSHQIRVQFASRGFPLAGDHKYGARDEATAPMLFSSGLRFCWNGQDCAFHMEPDWNNAAGGTR